MESETMKGERLWHYPTLLLGQRAARARLAALPKKLLPAALQRRLLPAAPLRRFLLAVQPAARVTNNFVRNAL